MRVPPRIPSAIFAAAVAVQATSLAAEQPPLTPEGAKFFEQKVRPLLIERCYACHSHGKEIKGGLTLDSRAGWEKGGDSGPAIVPQKPDESQLVKAVRYKDTDLQMPPTGRLADAEIAILDEWVRIEAPDPRDEVAAAAAKGRDHAAAQTHWAYQPLQKTAAPSVRDTTWPLVDIDRFVLAALEAKGLKPSPDADRYTWLRRVSLDLTGLPPTPEEIQAFVNDRSQVAFEQVVDRLLASRAYGERWARPWLDLVGYADQIGSANNVPAEHAWRYRDYVIRALSADKPFDEFVREQLAGDLLSAGSVEERRDQLTATGFLVLGNVNIVEADKLVMRMDLVDQQIEKIGKAFLGMTLNCARCHDHKFDPITLNDYYGLAGIFASTESTYRADRGIWSTVTKAQLPETLKQFTEREALARAHERKVAPLRDELAAADARLRELAALVKAAKELPAASNPAPVAGAKPLAELEKEQAELSGKSMSLQRQLQHLNYLKPAPPLAFAVAESASIANERTQVRGNPHVLGPVVPRGFVRVATHGPPPVVPNEQSGRLQLADWLVGAASPLVSRVTVNRVWQKLFGRGIVGSVDYFGVRGELPTHPALLDRLANQFIRERWSQKRLLRGIVLSRSYRQQAAASHASRPALAVDPDNRLLWRMSPRRLDAEMLRDAVLAVSGGLQPSAGGPSLAPEFIENVGGLDPKDVNPISFSLTKFRDDQPRLRTIYLPVARSSEQIGPAEVLNFFDFTQPARLAGDRPTTAVASQALFLLNGPLLKDAATRLRSSLFTDAALAGDDDRLSTLYVRVLNRPPIAEETVAARAFLSASADPAAVTNPSDVNKAGQWERLIRALLASNEFLFRL